MDFRMLNHQDTKSTKVFRIDARCALGVLSGLGGSKSRITAPTAFTLTELMIAIALVLILILGINQVFRITTETVGHGQALSTITRDKRSAQAVLYEDLRTAVSFEEAPFFMIRSGRVSAFRNQADLESDFDYDPSATPPARDVMTRTIDTTGDNSDDFEISPITFGYRNYRVDRLGFFGRDRFQRQTGNTDSEYIADLDSNEAYIWYGHLRKPVDPDVPTSAFNPGDEIATTNRQNFYASDWILGRVVMLLREKDDNGQILDVDGNPQEFFDRGVDYGPGISSLAPFARPPAPTLRTNVYWHRYDLAATAISLYRIAVEHYTGTEAWWSVLSRDRFQGAPYPTKPLTGYGVARTVPVFLQHCSQFMVEFAGDFLTQNDNGMVVDDQPDGTIDFYIDPVTGVREIQWYGLFRDVNGDGDPDVIPVWFAAGASDSTAGPYEFERPPVAGHYIAAWGPDVAGEPTPSMIRITVTLEDPTGRLEEGQTFEYVMRLP